MSEIPEKVHGSGAVWFPKTTEAGMVAHFVCRAPNTCSNCTGYINAEIFSFMTTETEM